MRSTHIPCSYILSLKAVQVRPCAAMPPGAATAFKTDGFERPLRPRRGFMPAVLVFDTSLDDLMVDFQSPSPNKVDEFLAIVHPQISKIARKHGNDLPKDVREEVKNETLRLLLTRNRAIFDSGRGTAWQYLHGNVLNAIQLVRGAYGHPTKRSISEQGESSGPSLFVDLTQAPQVFLESAAEGIHRAALLSQVLRLANPNVRYALSQIYLVGNDRSVVAAVLGISRFALARQIASFAQSEAILRRCA
jgi:hypothetical protein